MNNIKITRSGIARIGEDRIIDGAEREMFGLDNPGFCVECGAEHDACEPDARNYECYECGENSVFGAAELLIHL